MPLEIEVTRGTTKCAHDLAVMCAFALTALYKPVLDRVDTKPNNAAFRQNFPHPALKVFVKFLLEDLHIILVAALPNTYVFAVPALHISLLLPIRPGCVVPVC